MKNLMLSAVCFFCALMASSQSKFGVQASGIMSSASFNTTTNDRTNKDLNTGFGAGVFTEIAVNNKLTIKPGLNFMKKGVKVTNTYTDEGTQYKANINANLNYLEVPVLAIYNFKGSEGKWFLGAGPSASYGLSGKLKGNVTVSDGQKEPFKVDAFKKGDGADFNRLDVGLEGVAGHNINKNLALQVNYLHGLSNIANSSNFESNKFKNRNVMLSLKYRI